MFSVENDVTCIASVQDNNHHHDHPSASPLASTQQGQRSSGRSRGRSRATSATAAAPTGAVVSTSTATTTTIDALPPLRTTYASSISRPRATRHAGRCANTRLCFCTSLIITLRIV
ncbi:hypothetical protein V1477_009849 [Vespula maculifrons]|uniref:Uncharacterized protein n=1 Tax=Vespula maculifrons TaxID=7453 RepID=A0ABD2CAY6_VESMC